MKNKLAFIGLFAMSAVYAQPRYEEYRSYSMERTAEQDLQFYYLEKNIKDIDSGKKIALDGDHMSWRLCYGQASRGLVTVKECDDSVKDKKQLALWKEAEKRKYATPIVEIYIEGVNE